MATVSVVVENIAIQMEDFQYRDVLCLAAGFAQFEVSTVIAIANDNALHMHIIVQPLHSRCYSSWLLLRHKHCYS